jgi:hypothetical protein
MVRAYTRHSDGSYATLLRATPSSSGPFVMESPAGALRTVAVLPDATWERAVTASGAPGLVKSWQEPHHLIAATMLTDALRRSGF